MARETSDESKAAFAEAEARIRNALDAGATELSLFALGLTEVPESLGQLAQLQQLDLRYNGLTPLPESRSVLSLLK